MTYPHYAPNRDYDEFSFLHFSQKVKVLELRVVVQTYINLHIPVILSPNSSLYDLQKRRYRFWLWAPNRNAGENGRGREARSRIDLEISNLEVFRFITYGLGKKAGSKFLRWTCIFGSP